MRRANSLSRGRQQILDLYSYRVFTNLYASPLQSFRSIARNLSLSPDTVRDRVGYLKQRKIIRGNYEINDEILGNRTISETEAEYDPASLGLNRIDVFFTSIPSAIELSALRSLLSVHPYTHFQTEVFSDGLTLHARFDVPSDSITLLDSLFLELRGYGLFLDLEVFQPTRITPFKADFSVFDPLSMKWVLPNYNNWLAPKEHHIRINRSGNYIQQLWESLLETIESEDYRPLGGIKPHLREPSRISQLDAFLIRELTINARVPVKFLSTVYKKDPSLISRKLAKIREKYMASYNLIYDRRIFEMTVHLLITGDFKPKSAFYEETFLEFFKNWFPFEAIGHTSPRTFLLDAFIPGHIVADLAEFLWDHAENVSIYHVSETRSRKYYFFPQNLDESGKWITDKRQLVDIPVEIVENELHRAF